MKRRKRDMLLFMKVLFTQFIAEMGDKTQLMLVAMTSKFKLKDILLGTGVRSSFLTDWQFWQEVLSAR